MGGTYMEISVCARCRERMRWISKDLLLYCIEFHLQLCTLHTITFTEV
jgi:hypothetical protein